MAMPTIFKVDFGQDEMEILHKHVEDKVKYLKAKTTNLRESLLPKWVRMYRGIPAEAEATIPWKGAANLVIQIAGTHCDELLARVMAIWQTAPVFVAELYADYEDGLATEQKEMLERFLDKMAFEPRELDLYRVEETMFSSTIRYGTGLVKIPYEYLVEKQPVAFSMSDATGSAQYTYDEIIKRDGPHPEAVPLNKFGIDSKYATAADADFFYHIATKDRDGIKQMMSKKQIFDPDALEKVLLQPDRQGPDEFTQELQGVKSESVGSVNNCSDEYDIYECWYKYYKDGSTYSIISYYHLGTNTHCGDIFNIYPQNETPIEDAKLAYDDENYFGYGFCEMLDAYQTDISKMHNWRRNNRDFAMTGVGRVNKNSKLSSILQLFPGLLIPADEGEIESLNFGAHAMEAGTEDEQLTLSLAKERTGIDPAIGGAGGGIVNAKRGIYSAQGTSAVMQQQNNRNGLRMSDMRSAHVRIGRKIANIYSHFGIGNKIRMFGEDSQLLLGALQAYKDKKLGLAIKAATASNNKELEKQNDILVTTTLERMYSSDAQIIQAIVTPGCPPQLVEYYMEVLKAKNALFKHMLRNFGRDDVQRLVPVPKSLIKDRQNGGNNLQASGQSVSPGSFVPVGGFPTANSVPEGPPTQ